MIIGNFTSEMKRKLSFLLLLTSVLFGTFFNLDLSGHTGWERACNKSLIEEGQSKDPHSSFLLNESEILEVEDLSKSNKLPDFSDGLVLSFRIAIFSEANFSSPKNSVNPQPYIGIPKYILYNSLQIAHS